MSATTLSQTPTIFALATGLGRAAIAVIRASGSESARILEALCGALPPARHASFRPLRYRGDVLDHALILWLPGPRSYTGEDSFELHLHAGHAIIESVSDALTALGARPAEPGEFTRRAVQAGRLDLLQAEAIADLVDAETQAQRKQALQQADGALSQLYNGWSQRLRHVLAQQEALIDFPDEELPPEVERALLEECASLRRELSEHLSDERGEITREGLKIVIAGAPNVGKSSLLNRLCGFDAAIVTHKAGTTRDAIRVDWILDGIKLRLIDTAGLRETDDDIEAEGIKRALQHVKNADMVLHLVGPEETSSPVIPDAIKIRTKTDLAPAREGEIGIHTQDETGISALRDYLKAHIKQLMSERSAPPLTRARHRAGLEEARRHLEQAEHAVWPEVRGEELRLAMQALGRLTGHVDVEALLDTIFGQFCIGK
ncbi:tRNA uridine-5-carboxymethylaminomethyl(34) synthesis GTPase MnmE [Saccharibacter sp. 17.LH.SD]|uniref:tRNA uridine-5-carboxymethylaminomethyl(34) synthesis GTPase MnmE n=1 Tax=Saccharibacter sp. 17.LH.SD TaxID=2689393 RepID=UPI0013683F4E|nr:tRNA uridine-5-carboxymethylaminomethyl(34) synthesis GTPase MnmE [Saccharibacter sp. 17.LH.SD]MXV45142.1 tRNA uridine-5-carboxymethylaminomethyl(34) synthesis GTPase MnmE [Saccharibacter sp. 17.LH.SD]